MIQLLKSASKIFDFIFFPQIKFQYLQVLEEYGQVYRKPYAELEEFLKLMVSPSPLDSFYNQNFFVYKQIFQYIDITQYESLHAFLEGLLTLDSLSIQNIVLDSTRTYSQNHIQEDWLDLLNQLPIEDQVKWQVHMAYASPKKTMQVYVKEMKKILPQFENTYANILDKESLHQLETKIHQDGPNFFVSIWKDYYNEAPNIDLDQAKTIQYVLVSSASPLIASLAYPLLPKNFYLLGIHLEEYQDTLFNVRFLNAEHLVLFFKNLADPSRFHVLMEVAKGNGSNMHIAKALGISAATTSYHLMSLNDSNLIYRDKTQKGIFYRINHPGIRKGFQAFLKYLDSVEKESLKKEP